LQTGVVVVDTVVSDAVVVVVAVVSVVWTHVLQSTGHSARIVGARTWLTMQSAKMKLEQTVGSGSPLHTGVVVVAVTVLLVGVCVSVVPVAVVVVPVAVVVVPVPVVV
jgi:hypothetical protein